MLVQMMDVTLYQDDGWTWRTEEVRQPTWEAVEAAICRLDRFHFPFVWLYLSAEREQGHVTDARVLIPGSIPDFEVVGGDGEYAMNANLEGRTWRYFDPSRDMTKIPIWRSDQGADFEACYCCPALETVLQATRHFCEQGTLDQRVQWQSCPAQP
jgi:hypothetical protein